MRAFSVVLVLAWLLGIILGVAGVSPVVVILVSLATGFIGSRVRQSVQVATVAAVLVCLGFVWWDITVRLIGGRSAINGAGDGGKGGMHGLPMKQP